MTAVVLTFIQQPLGWLAPLTVLCLAVIGLLSVVDASVEGIRKTRIHLRVLKSDRVYRAYTQKTGRMR